MHNDTCPDAVYGYGDLSAYVTAYGRPGPKTIKKNTNSTPNKSQTQRLVLT